jgi:hypothetical protein
VLQKAGYEDDPLWFEKLPGRAQDGLDAPPPDRLLKQAVELQAEVVRLREQARWLTEARDQRARERGQAGGGEA